MAHVTVLGRVSALAILFAASQAGADVKAADVWAGWKGLAEGYGQTMTTGSEEFAGNTLTVRNLTSTMTFPEGSATSSLGELVMAEQGDGTVKVSMSPDYRVVTAMKTENGEAVEFTLLLSHSGLEMVVSGTPEAMSYDYQAATMTMALVDLETDGEKVTVDAKAVISAVTGTYVVTEEGEARHAVSDLSADKLSLTADFDGTATGEQSAVKLLVDLVDLSIRQEGTLVGIYNMARPDQMLKAGGQEEGSMTFGETSYNFSFKDAADWFDTKGTMESGSFNVAFLADGLTYATKGLGIDMAFSGSEIPLPEVGLHLDESAFRVVMPVMAADEAQDVGLLLAYRGLTISDGIWGLVDPTGILPRDPATFAIDLTGKGRWLIDIMDPDATAEMSTMPGQVDELTLNELEISAAGAKLTGTGAMSIDNAALAMGGMPVPAGAVDLQLVGANGLLDKLVELGVMTSDDTLGYRMMMGLFAQPGEGEDTLVSKIEMTPEGKLLANGQPLN